MIKELLIELLNKGFTIHTQHKGDLIMGKLKELLPESDYRKLVIARSHHFIGEGRQEGDRVCNELIKKYSA